MNVVGIDNSGMSINYFVGYRYIFIGSTIWNGSLGGLGPLEGGLQVADRR